MSLILFIYLCLHSFVSPSVHVFTFFIFSVLGCCLILFCFICSFVHVSMFPFFRFFRFLIYSFIYLFISSFLNLSISQFRQFSVVFVVLCFCFVFFKLLLLLLLLLLLVVLVLLLILSNLYIYCCSCTSFCAKAKTTNAFLPTQESMFFKMLLKYTRDYSRVRFRAMFFQRRNRSSVLGVRFSLVFFCFFLVSILFIFFVFS